MIFMPSQQGDVTTYVLMVMDNAAQHKTKKIRRYLKKNPDVVLLYLPVARPELSAIEAVWKDAKYRLVTSAFYDTVDHPIPPRRLPSPYPSGHVGLL